MKLFRQCDYSKEASQYHFPVVLFIMMHKMVLTFESMDKILTCDHSNVANAVLFFGAVYYAVPRCF